MGSANGHRSVLVVDDDPSVLATYRRLLSRAGYRTHVSDDPARLLVPGCPDVDVDLLLLDYKMPAMDGLSLLAELRRRECQARCVLVTACLDDDQRRQAKHLGVDRVLDKPVDIGLLRQVIDELLGQAGSASVAGRKERS